MTPSSSLTASVSVTQAPTTSPTPSPGVAVAGALLVDLRASASDFSANATYAAWDNRVTFGAVSSGNGDFVLPAGAAAAGAIPSLTTRGGVSCVLFDASAPGGSQQLTSAYTALPSTSIWGGNDW